ncbi:hypothetical protein IWX48DRAFT_689867 [Phyllosticta citricarpa]
MPLPPQTPRRQRSPSPPRGLLSRGPMRRGKASSSARAAETTTTTTGPPPVFSLPAPPAPPPRRAAAAATAPTTPAHLDKRREQQRQCADVGRRVWDAGTIIPWTPPSVLALRGPCRRRPRPARSPSPLGEEEEEDAEKAEKEKADEDDDDDDDDLATRVGRLALGAAGAATPAASSSSLCERADVSFGAALESARRGRAGPRQERAPRARTVLDEERGGEEERDARGLEERAGASMKAALEASGRRRR